MGQTGPIGPMGLKEVSACTRFGWGGWRILERETGLSLWNQDCRGARFGFLAGGEVSSGASDLVRADFRRIEVGLEPPCVAKRLPTSLTATPDRMQGRLLPRLPTIDWGEDGDCLVSRGAKARSGRCRAQANS